MHPSSSPVRHEQNDFLWMITISMLIDIILLFQNGKKYVFFNTSLCTEMLAW